MDYSLRELGRRFRATGGVEDEANYLSALLRADYLTETQIITAARLKHPASELLFPGYSCPLLMGGTSFYEGVDNYLFELATMLGIRPTPAIPFFLANTYLDEAQRIFEISPLEDVVAMAAEGVEVGNTFNNIANSSRESFRMWAETRWNPSEANSNSQLFASIEVILPVWEAAAQADFDRDIASFHNAADAYMQFSHEVIRVGPPGDYTNPASLTNLRLAINSVIDSLAEYSALSHLETQAQLLNSIRPKMLPYIFDNVL